MPGELAPEDTSSSDGIECEKIPFSLAEQAIKDAGLGLVREDAVPSRANVEFLVD
jgi:hypothetical protein